MSIYGKLRIGSPEPAVDVFVREGVFSFIMDRKDTQDLCKDKRNRSSIAENAICIDLHYVRRVFF